jgi:hypothetical protein
MAAQNGHEAVVRLLIEHKAEVNKAKPVQRASRPCIPTRIMMALRPESVPSFLAITLSLLHGRRRSSATTRESSSTGRLPVGQIMTIDGC